MADGISVRIIGPDIAALAAESTAKMIAASEESLDKIAQAIQSDASANCPVAGSMGPVTKEEHPGELRDDISIASSIGKRQIGNMSVYYAQFVHNGTYKMKGRPYLLNASEANKDKWVADIVANPGI